MPPIVVYKESLRAKKAPPRRWTLVLLKYSSRPIYPWRCCAMVLVRAGDYESSDDEDGVFMAACEEVITEIDTAVL